MIRSLTLALALAAAPAWAGGPGFSISGASTVGIPGLPGVAQGTPCRASGNATILVTFTDPDGISYAAVDLGAVRVRPDVSGAAEARLWLPDYARPGRGYRWRYEDVDGHLQVRHTMPVEIDLVPGAGPIQAEIWAKNGRGALTVRRLALIPDACRSPERQVARP